jgi:hypothetical protein
MVIMTLQTRPDPPAYDRPHHSGTPQQAFWVLPAEAGMGPAIQHVLRPESMVAVPLEPGERVDSAWVARMRGPYTSRARHLVQRAATAPAAGPLLADHHVSDPVPTWAREAAAGQRGLLDALGVDLPLGSTGHARPGGSVLVQHLVPAIALGWYLVTTVHATEHAVLLLEGSYAEHEANEAPFPVSWS